MKKVAGVVMLLGFLICSWGSPPDASAKRYVFFGGPDGGTYQYYAKAISELATEAGMTVRTKSSAGSVVNVRLVHSGKADFGVAYSGDLFKARQGMLTRDSRKYTDVLALGYFYSAAAQLVVRADSGITSAKQLAGRHAGVGNFGSGAAATCELFLTEIGTWHKVQKEFLGYTDAAVAFKKRQLDAFWVFTGFPNGSVKQAAGENRIALANTYKDAEECGMLQKYPYFSKITVPANTYKGVSTKTATFQDSSLWIAGPSVPTEDVYQLLRLVYSAKGLAHMRNTHKSAKNMTLKNGVNGIVTPLHPGAEKFWKEKRILK